MGWITWSDANDPQLSGPTGGGHFFAPESREDKAYFEVATSGDEEEEEEWQNNWTLDTDLPIENEQYWGDIQ